MTNEPPFTILGASGWIGSALVAGLQRQGNSVNAIDRTSLSSWLSSNRPTGTVVYAIGMTSDFRQRPHETVEAHVSLLSQVIQRKGLEDLVLISSTRVYARSQNTSEDSALPCQSTDPSDIYNISKLLGEALILQDPRPGLKVVRLSNVIGQGQPKTTFIGSVLSEARRTGCVNIKQPPTTTKDYVSLDSVIELIPLIAKQGRHRLYNLGSGINFSHADVARWLQRQGTMVTFSLDADPGISFPRLQIERLLSEFDQPENPFIQELL